jgi:hypothetical protein
MRVMAACALLMLTTSCPPSADGPPDGSAGTGGTGGMAGACPVFYYTEPGCGDETQGRCFPNNGGACAGGYCSCDGKIKFEYCTGSEARFAYRIPWPTASGKQGQPCDPKADAPPP